MSLVATLTLSPALDKSTSVAGIVPEQKLHCAPPKTEAGGGGINVSRGLQRLGTLSVAIYPAGGGHGRAVGSAADRREHCLPCNTHPKHCARKLCGC